jgi:type I restriction enzyme S subunit
MAALWEDCLLGDVVNLKRGYDLPHSARVAGSFPVVSSSGVTDFHAEAKVKAPGVVTGRYGTLGQVFYIKSDYWPLNTSLYVQDFKGNDPRFIAYFLGSLSFDSQNAAGAGPGVNRNHLHAMKVRIPTPPVQQRIAAILSAYDELIENSQQRIKILESMARALYREALTAEGENVALLPLVESPYWRFISENVSEYTGTKRYLATADIDGLEVSGPGIDYLFAEKPSRAQKEPIPNSVWFARMKETYKIAWYGLSDDERASGDVLSSGFAGFEARDTELWPLLFLILSSREFHVQKDLYCTGATQMSLTNEGLKRIVLPLPDEQSARRLGRSVGPMLSSIAQLQRKIENLRRTRDLLLPRLLSGQIYVEETAL